MLLDGRPVKTPRKSFLTVPTRALAEAVAGEWAAQGDKIAPLSMPLTRLANTAIDRVRDERDKIVDEVLSFAGSDLVCYRAHEPADLVERQARHWDPILHFAQRELDAGFVTAQGITHVPQPEEALRAFEAYAKGLNDFALAGFHSLTTLTGSALLTAMLERQTISPEDAWTAAHVDEDWQIAQWGEDEEAMERRQRRHAEFLSCCRYLSCLKAG